ncbi:HAMP domain-containing protein, partial [Candidatus Venteria ishoeyi]
QRTHFIYSVMADLIYQNQVKEIKNTSHRLSRQNALKLLVHFEIKPKLAGHLDQFLQNINAHQLIVVNPQKQRLAQAVKPDFEILNNFQDFTHNALLEVALKEDRSVASSEHIKLNGQSFLAISAISPIHRSDRVKARSNAPNKRSDNSAIIGAVIVHYILNNNAQLSERIQDLLGVDAVIYQNGQAINYKTLQHTLSPPHIKPALYQQLISTPGNLEVAEIDFDGQLAEYQSVKNISGQAIAVLAISRSAAPYMQTILKAGLSMLGIMLFCIIGASVLGYWLAHSILGPLNHLLNGVKRITSGDLSYEISLDLKDEMGTLATAFNGMSRQLHELVETLEQRIEQATHKLQNALAHLAAIIDNMPDGLLVTDNRTLIIQVNPALSAMFPNYNNPESGSESLLEKECTQFNAEISELIHQSRLYPNKVHSAEIKLAGEHIGQAVATAIIQKDSLHEEAGTYIGSQYIGSVVLIRDITREKEIDQMMKNTIDTLTRVGAALSAERI